MNIKQHIEAGHYPKEGDAAAVPLRGGLVAYIYTTKHHPDWPIVGGVDGQSEPHAWRANGRITHITGDLAGYKEDSPLDLLPPPPRKVEVKGWLTLKADGTPWMFFPRFKKEAEDEIKDSPGWRCVELTGSYEMPWPEEA